MPAPVHESRVATEGDGVPPFEGGGLTERLPFVVVGGVPGAGKSTLLRQLQARRADLVVLDPEQVTARLSAAVGARVPYVVLRAASHTLHLLRVLLVLLSGPGGGRSVVAHETATRGLRTMALGTLARWRSWDPYLLLIDVTHVEARAGHLQRERVVSSRSFGRHWSRWERQFHLRGSVAVCAHGAWAEIDVTSRADAMTVAVDRLGPPGYQSTELPGRVQDDRTVILSPI